MPLRRIYHALALIFVVLTVLGLLSELLLSVFKVDWALGLVPLLNLSYQTNIPTWYTSILLLGCAGLLGGVAWIKIGQQAPFDRHWAALAAILAYLSINEVVRFHEVMNPALTDTYHLGGLFAVSWVIPFAILVALFCYAYHGFWRALPRRYRLWFGAAGALYVGGAIGSELALSMWYGDHGGDNFVYGLLNLSQASFEMLAATVFLAAILTYVSTEIGQLSIQPPAELPAKRPRRRNKRVSGISLTDKLKARYFLRYESR